MNTRTSISLTMVMLVGLFSLPLDAGAQDSQRRPRQKAIDWSSLNLSPQQNQQIQVLQEEWNVKYVQMSPQIRKQRKQLQSLLQDPKADPVEIVSTQQSMTRLQEQLRTEAMSNYLKKRAVLTDPQQRQVESQLHQMVVERQQRPLVPRNEPSEQQGGIMNLMEKVRWAIGQH